MDARKVESSVISRIGIEENDRILIVKFNSGEIYYYWPVNQDTFLRFVDADSKGRFFENQIREKSMWRKKMLEKTSELTPPSESDTCYMFKKSRDVDSFEELSNYV